MTVVGIYCWAGAFLSLSILPICTATTVELTYIQTKHADANYKVLQLPNKDKVHL
jgi:hypothetical protein